MSDHLYKGRPLRALFLGNADNFNLRTAVWSRAAGVDAHILLVGDENGPRSQVSDLIDTSNGNPDWVRVYPRGTVSEYLREMPKSKELMAYFSSFDVAITSGALSIQIAPILPIPAVHLSIGIEVAAHPFFVASPPSHVKWPRTPRQAASHVLSLLFPQRRQNERDVFDDQKHLAQRTRAGLSSVRQIFDAYIPNIESLEKLGLESKLVVFSIGEDVLANRRRVKPDLRVALQEKHVAAHKIFLWFSRLNFKDPEKGQAYKGVERYWAALERFRPEIESGRIALIFGRHGNDADEFIDLVKQSPIFPYVTWTPHLGWSDLLTWLSLPNAYLFSHFGERQIDLSGIARDALSVGAPVISSSTKAHVAAQLGAPPPFLEAVTVSDIAAQIEKIMSLSQQEDRAWREANRRYGEQYLNFTSYMDRFWPRVIDMLERKDHPASRET